MKLTVISPQGLIFDLEIDDWTPISRQKDLSEVGISCIDETERQTIKNTLLFYSINVDTTENGLLILDKPVEFKYNPKKEKLTLKYN